MVTFEEGGEREADRMAKRGFSAKTIDYARRDAEKVYGAGAARFEALAVVGLLQAELDRHGALLGVVTSALGAHDTASLKAVDAASPFDAALEDARNYAAKFRRRAKVAFGRPEVQVESKGKKGRARRKVRRPKDEAALKAFGVGEKGLSGIGGLARVAARVAEGWKVKAWREKMLACGVMNDDLGGFEAAVAAAQAAQAAARNLRADQRRAAEDLQGNVEEMRALTAHIRDCANAAFDAGSADLAAFSKPPRPKVEHRAPKAPGAAPAEPRRRKRRALRDHGKRGSAAPAEGAKESGETPPE
jgi:hypothetical protein